MKLNKNIIEHFGILNIEIAKYSIKTLNKLNAKSKALNVRKGFLLKIEFKNFGCGYSDCFSWEELGDVSLGKQIINLKHGIFNEHLFKSVYFASIDAKYRAKNENVFKDLILPKNHYTCTNYNELNSDFLEKLRIKGFSKIKIKCGSSLFNEINLLKNLKPILKKLNMQIRLDFNLTMNFKDISSFLVKVSDYYDVINFIEDPIIYNRSTWGELKKNFPNVKLALDKCDSKFLGFEKNDIKKSIDFFVIKPAVQNLNYFYKNISFFGDFNLVFTSYMDHPLGQLSALYEASCFYKNTLQFTEDCGFLTHTLYDTNSYSESFSIHDTRLIPSCYGTGFGFNDLLNKECWRKLK